MILDNEYNPDVRVYKEANYLVSNGHSVRILCWDRNKDTTKKQYENSEGIEIERFNFPSHYGSGRKQLPSYFRFIIACRKHLIKENYDYLHCHDLLSVIAGFCARRRNTPVVFDMHEYYEKVYPPRKSIRHALIVSLIKRSHAALHASDVYLDSLYFPVRDKLYPLKNYPDANILEAREKSRSNNCFRIGYYGYVRNQTESFLALFEAVKDMEDVRVDINGVYINSEILIDRAKEYQNVNINDAFDGTRELSELYQNTDVLFCPYNRGDSNFRACDGSVKYFEAIITGTPMISTKGLAVGDNVEKNNFGISIDTCNSNEIKTAIDILKNNKDVWNRYARNELKQAYLYDWNNVVKVLDQIYK